MFLRNLFSHGTDKAGTRFGYAVVGLGRIAEHFLDGLRDSPVCTATALVSGDQAKAARLAKKYGAASTYSYENFDRIVDDPAVHGVYLALPVSQHLEYTRRAAAAGKHVLCEKPMASTAGEARAMVAACAEAGVLLSVAYRCPHAAVHQHARQFVQSGALGPLASIRMEGAFGFPLEAADWRGNAAAGGGGSLWDVGVYPLNAARFLLAEDPVAVEDARAVCDAAGLERSIAWTSVFASGARAACTSSYDTKIPDTMRILGEGGSLMMAPAFSHRERYALRGQLNDGTVVDERTPTSEPSEFRMEAEALARSVLHGEPLLTPGEDGLADMVAMEAIYAAAGVPFPPRGV